MTASSIPPIVTGLAEFIAWLGIGIGMVITAIKTHRAELGIDKVAETAKRAAQASEQAATELSPNHGSSSKDSLARIEAKLAHVETEQQRQAVQQEHQAEMIKSIGHQIGEITTNAATARQMINSRLDDHSDRLAGIEEHVK